MAISNISEATGPIVNKCDAESSVAEGTKNCSNGSGHLTNIAALPLEIKNLE